MKKITRYGFSVIITLLFVFGTVNATSVMIDRDYVYGNDDLQDRSINLNLEVEANGATKMSNTTWIQPVRLPEIYPTVQSPYEEIGDEEWNWLESIMFDVSKEERSKMVCEFKKILNDTSTLSIDEQNVIIHKVTGYIIKATDGRSDAKWGSAHGYLSTAAGKNAHYVTPSHNQTLWSEAWWADQDENRDEPTVFGVTLNRHSWIIGGPGIPYCDNYGPESLEYYLDEARNEFATYDVNSAYTSIGRGLHFIEDLGCPFHTSTLYGQAHHLNYERWASNKWSEIESATETSQYYIITDPSEDSKYLAQFSNQYIPSICDILNNDPDWENNQDLVNITRDLITETEKMTLGMLVYATKHECPQTEGSNFVSIDDLNTTYADINNVACSENMYFVLQIDHTDVSDLEIWTGWKYNQSSDYTEVKIWDHEEGSGDTLNFVVGLTDFEDVHDWRLRIVDSSAGGEGRIESFYLLIG